MFGHFVELPAVPGLPEAPAGALPVDVLPEDDELVVGVFVDVLVAAKAAAPLPKTRAPVRPMAAAVLWIARMLLTSLRGSISFVLTVISQTVGPGRAVGVGQEAIKNLNQSFGGRSRRWASVR
jgi:hypothetical protein